MQYRRLGRTGWPISEIGYGMWAIGGGPGGWSGTDGPESMAALRAALDKGCTFFDTAWIYGRGHSEQVLGSLRSERPDVPFVVATKIPPKDRAFPSTRTSRWQDVFPDDHVEEYLSASERNLGGRVDLLQYHVWEDSWLDDERFVRQMVRLRESGRIGALGISINRWEPWNGLRAVTSGLVDSVQVGFNVFDQSPADELLPACNAQDVGVIARVPFDEGALTGALTTTTTWPDGDWRNSYFVSENLVPTIERVERLRAVVPEGMALPELALRFILAHPEVSTVIPGMRSRRHVDANFAAADGPPLEPAVFAELLAHRWDREPTAWSQ